MLFESSTCIIPIKFIIGSSQQTNMVIEYMVTDFDSNYLNRENVLEAQLTITENSLICNDFSECDMNHFMLGYMNLLSDLLTFA